MIALSTQLEKRTRVLEEAEFFLGARFHMRAAVPPDREIGEAGAVDCGTFLCMVYAAAGISTPDVRTLGHFRIDWALHTQQERYLEIIEKFTRRVPVPEPDDIIMIRYPRKDGPLSHSAILVKDQRIIHAMWGHGVQYGRLDQPPLSGCERIYLSPF